MLFIFDNSNLRFRPAHHIPPWASLLPPEPTVFGLPAARYLFQLYSETRNEQSDVQEDDEGEDSADSDEDDTVYKFDKSD